MTMQTKSGAVIYTRVSSRDQVEGYSLDTQERACREFAARAGYDVVKVFTERGESAKTADRTQLQAMLKYVKENERLLAAVIVNKVDRLARNSTDHGNLRVQLGEHHVRLQSTTENLDDTPAGRFAETVLSGIAQLDNEVRAERAKGGMVAAVAAGKFVWPAPIGYVSGPKGGPSLVPDSPLISGLVRKAWILVESGMPPYEARVQLAREGLRLRSGKTPSPHSFRAMLKSETYIGYINAFGERVRGDFEPLVAADLFRRVQELLAKQSRTVARPYKKANPDFPLRGTVLCPHCGQPLTAAWSRGHGGRYGYYRCNQCSRVAFRKEILEPKFVGHLDKLSLKPSLVSMLSKAIEANLGSGAKSKQQTVRKLEAQLEGQHKRKRQIAEKSLSGDLPKEIVRELLEEVDRFVQALEEEKLHYSTRQRTDLDIVNAGLTLLDRMGSLWNKSNVAIRKRLQRFVFPEGTSFDGEKFGTSVLPACLQLKGTVGSSKVSLVPQPSEPPTPPCWSRLFGLGHILLENEEDPRSAAPLAVAVTVAAIHPQAATAAAGAPEPLLWRQLVPIGSHAASRVHERHDVSIWQFSLHHGSPANKLLDGRLVLGRRLVGVFPDAAHERLR